MGDINENTTLITFENDEEIKVDINELDIKEIKPDIRENVSKQSFYYNKDIVPAKVGKCDIIEQIGEGGGSIVYLAYHNNLKTQVVIKRYKYIRDEMELELLLKLKHPYIPNVYDFIEQDGEKYLIMEFIRGEPLDWILRKGALDNKKFIKYATQLCETVEYLHSQNPPIMHGDIKPGNIIISEKDDISLIDFNISLPMDSIKKPIGFTRPYAPPEIKHMMSDWRNQENQIQYDQIRVDIYQIGATLFEMLTGMCLSKVLDNEIILDLDNYDENLLNIIDKAVEEDPQKRYKSVKDMKNRLMKKVYEYDVALSFAGEDRKYVEKIAKRLKKNDISVFYDKFETANLWGKDLYQYLSHIYKDNARYCVIFISESYKNKAWTRHELKNAQNRAFSENKEYILPIFLEEVELDGLNDTTGYLNASVFSEREIVDFIIEKCNNL